VTKFSAPQQNQLAQIGAYLRDNREKQGKSLEDIAIRTYIRPQLLNGIETGDPELLPEPIFVQGFIRRYAEALEINGKELAQQFTVNSIPSTPRPARRPDPEDSATTRLSRVSSNRPPATADTTATTNTAPMFSAGSLNTGNPAPTSTPANTPAAATNTNPFKSNEVINSPESKTEDIKALDNTFQVQPDETTVDSDLPNSTPLLDNALNTSAQNGESQVPLDQLELGVPDQQAIDDVFASKIAAFDQQNLKEDATSQADNLELNLEGTSLNLGTPQTNNATFSDVPPSLTTDLTTEATSATPPLPAAAGTPPASRPTLPVGMEYSDTNNSPNLKPFIIGGIIAAALTAAMVILASVLGGGEQRPNLAETPDSVEQAEEAPVNLETPEIEEPEVAATPPVSTAPVFVEATATSEAWVDIIADGNSIFEGTLQAGDTQVWEAQESLSIYSGDAGALELAANGGEAEVMGDRGQPAEKIFP